MNTFARTLWLSLTLSLLAVTLFSILGFEGNLSRSEPRGIYQLTHALPRRGSYVVLKMPLKQIAGLPGDTVRVTPQGSYINGVLWPYSGIPDPPLITHYPFGTYRLRSGQYWVLGYHPLSWDSRYVGPIPSEMINSTVKPIWTASNGYAPGTTPLTRSTHNAIVSATAEPVRLEEPQ